MLAIISIIIAVKLSGISSFDVDQIKSCSLW